MFARFHFALVLGIAFSTSALAKPVPSDAELAARPEIAAEYQDFLRGDLASDFNFSGQARLPGCSGSVVSFGQSANAAAIVLTNGHCIGMLDGNPNAVIINREYSASISLYVNHNQRIPARVTHIAYGLLMPHDIAFLRLGVSYAELAARGVFARRVSARMAAPGTQIALASGLYNTVAVCPIEGIIPQIREDVYVNTDSYKYHCNAIHGTSGSPLVDIATGEVIGVNYTGNDDGARCTMNNPCEVDERGNVTVERGANYGDQVYKVMTCLNAAAELDLMVPGCLLRR